MQVLSILIIQSLQSFWPSVFLLKVSEAAVHHLFGLG